MFHKKAFTCNENTKYKGNKGEDAACKFLENNKFAIVGRNYARKWGEIDIIAKKEGILNFFEVKSVTYKTLGEFDAHRPEDNVNALKVSHLRRIIETYLYDKSSGQDQEFKFHVLCVYLDMETRLARVKWIKDVIL